jgi:hypothetical protein
LIYFGIWCGDRPWRCCSRWAAARASTISAQQDRNPLYVRLSDGAVRNNYTVKPAQHGVFVVSPAGDGSRQEFSLSVQANDDPYPSDRHELVLERGE